MLTRTLVVLGLSLFLRLASGQTIGSLTDRAAHGDPSDRLGWWRDARFGMFIHWGLYAIPAGKWGDKDTYGEWIMSYAQIPVEEYEQIKSRFNPGAFDARAWVHAAKAAGMRYIVLTAKHHEGFCLFDSALTDYDVMATPFGRDVVKELSDACRAEGVRFCVYYSIMDWHHPDYLPRREWEARPTAGADFERYVAYMKGQLRELLTNYGPIGVLWFDGQWEGTWTHERAKDLYRYVRSIQPSLIVNNRIDKGGSAHGMNRFGEFAGDFGTPEQEVPAMGYPGVDWESCLTMNEHWGYNAADQKFKSAAELIRTLADVASKGGNLLLNVGPDADGHIPPKELERLTAIGRWMDANGESVYGTSAGPFPLLSWGRCTQRGVEGGDTRLYLHVFDWPRDETLVVPGLYSRGVRAFLLADASHAGLELTAGDGELSIRVPRVAPDPVDTVVVLDLSGMPDVAMPPEISAPAPIFVDRLVVTISTPRRNVELRYTMDGSEPGPGSPKVEGPLVLEQTTTVRARAFRDGRAVSPSAAIRFVREAPAPAAAVGAEAPGLRYAYFEGDWKSTSEFEHLSPKAAGVAHDLSRRERLRESHFGLRYRGFIEIPAVGVYAFYLASDDGSRMLLDGKLLIDNDGLHSLEEKSGVAALAKGLHPIEIDFFESSGGHELELWWEGPGLKRERVPSTALRCEP